MEKEKKAINILIIFFISRKSDVKTFLKWILNQCHTALVNMTHNNNNEHFIFSRAAHMDYSEKIKNTWKLKPN